MPGHPGSRASGFIKGVMKVVEQMNLRVLLLGIELGLLVDIGLQLREQGSKAAALHEVYHDACLQALAHIPDFFQLLPVNMAHKAADLGDALHTSFHAEGAESLPAEAMAMGFIGDAY